MANERPTLYCGMTNDLVRRVYEHKIELDKSSFTARYKLKKLVYYELVDNSRGAIIREKQIKNMSLVEKIEMIREYNSEFRDLYDDIVGQIPDKPK
jgi:putative endonuclease